MSTIQQATFNEVWKTEIQLAADQMTSRLMPTVTVDHFTGNVYHAPILGQVVAQTQLPGSLAPIPFNNISATKIDITPGPLYIKLGISDYDAARSSADYRASFIKRAVGGIYKAIDNLIIQQALTSIATLQSSNVITLPTTNTLDGAGVAALREKLNLNEKSDMPSSVVMPPRGNTNLINDTTFTGSFNFQNDFIQNGRVTKGAGFNAYVLSNLLPNGTSGAGYRRVFAYTNDCVLLAFNKEMNSNVYYDNDRESWVVSVSCMAGAAITDPAGVIAADMAVS